MPYISLIRSIGVRQPYLLTKTKFVPVTVLVRKCTRCCILIQVNNNI